MSIRPRRLGKYELQEQLGHGGMAEVWKALDTQLQRYVAIKLLHANLKEDPHFIARFEREAQLIASLHHPNIVQIHDFQFASSEEEGTIAYMVMDYVEGQTLADYIRRTSGLGNVPSPPEIVQLFTSIGLAVDYAHQQGMIHRDLKPANILLDKHNTARNHMGEPILTDFGLARLLKSPAVTLTAAQLGTPLYIAPEQVTGTPPFQGDNPTAVMTQHLNTAPPSPALINPNIPPALEMVMLRCLAKEPAARFPSASLLAAAIAESLNVPVPQSLAKPAFPPLGEYMPTSIIPSPPASAPGTTPSSPASPPSVLAQPGSSFVSWSSGDKSAPPVSMGSSSGASTLTPSPMGIPTPPASPARQRRWRLFGLIALLTIVMGGSLGAYFLFLQPGRGTPPPGPIAGHAFYVSSGQLADGAQGVADQVQVDLQNIQVPPPGKSYYLWLLADKDTTPEKDLLG